VEEYRELGGEAEISQQQNECRISNPPAGVAATITVDPEAHTIQYTYEAEQRT